MKGKRVKDKVVGQKETTVGDLNAVSRSMEYIELSKNRGIIYTEL